MSTFKPGRAGVALLLLGGLAGVMAAGAAGAATSDNDPPSIVVKYSDLTLATDSGVNQLYRRITAAARQVCPDAPIRDLGMRQQVQACRNQAVARAVRQIDNSRLAALHASHTKNG
jgi:UrcA family protein